MSAAPRRPPVPPLPPDAVAAVAAWVEEGSGMAFGQAKAYYLERRVAERMEATGVGDPTLYLRRLREDAVEAQALLNRLTVKETYFYRETRQLECLTRHLLPEVVAGRGAGDRVRLWSNPCATGEEAYSLAIWLLESWRMVDAYHVEILGSDLDTAALEAAREGRYGARALHRLPRTVLDSYFEPPAGGERRLIADIRESVQFAPANLLDPVSLAAQGRFDVIFCRNVLIYFEGEARRRALDALYARLAPGGFLCLGQADGLGEVDARLQVCRFPGATVWRRGDG